MKALSKILILFIVACTSCSSRSAREDRLHNTSRDSIKAFRLPDIPLTLQTPEDRSIFLSKHYWDNFAFTDTNCIHHPEITEQAWVDYIDLLKIVPDTIAQKGIKYLFDKADINRKVYLYFTELADKYLYDPNSPMRNEEFYISVLETMLTSRNLSTAEKIRPQERRKMAEKNRVGKRAINFDYTLASGKNGTLHAIKSDYLLLFINNPGCHACEETIEVLKNLATINKKISNKSLIILSIYPDEYLAEWKHHLSDFPREWINGYDKKQIIRNENLYDLKAIPTLYLLDKDKKVLLKDANANDVEAYLEKTN